MRDRTTGSVDRTGPAGQRIDGQRFRGEARRVVAAALAVAAVIGTCDAASAAEKVWTGAAGTSSWHDANNWSPAGAPGATDDVVIDVPGSITVNFTTGTTTVASLQCAETLGVDGGTLTVSTTADITGSASLNGGTIQGGVWTLSSPLTISSSLNNRLNGVEVIGDLVMSQSSARLRILNGLKVSGQVLMSGANGRIYYEGTQTWGPATVVATGSGADVGSAYNSPASTLTLGPDFVLEGGGWDLGPAIGVDATIVNQGVIRTTAAGIAQVVASTFTNTGTVHSLAGTLNISSGTWTNPGGSLIASGGVLGLSGTLNNTGSTLFIDSTSGTLLLDGGTVQGGTISITPPGALAVSNSSNNRLDGVEVIGDLVMSQSSARLRILNGLKVSGQVLMSGANGRLYYEGTQTWGPATVVATGSGADVGPAWTFPGGTLTLGPEFVLEGGGWDLGQTFSTAAALVNQGVIRTTAAGDAQVVANTFINSGQLGPATGGALRMTTPSWTNTSAGSLVGTVTLDGAMVFGELDLTGGGTLAVTSNSNNRLNGVEVIGDLAMSATNSTLRILNGLKVSGQVLMSGANGRLYYEGTQTWGPATVVATGSGADVGPAWTFPGGTLTLGPEFVLEGGGWDLGQTFSTAAALVNQGVIRTTAAGDAQVVASTFSNAGTVQSQAGTLTISSAAVTNLAANTLTGGTWFAGPGAALSWPAASIRTLGPSTHVSLSGAGSNFAAINGLTTLGAGSTFELAGGRDFNASPLGGTFTNNGTLKLGSQSEIAVAGVYTQGASGLLDASFEGAVGPTRLTSTGNLNLNGTAALSFVGGYSPLLGQSITLASTSTGTRNGAFAGVLHPFARLCTIETVYGASSVSFGLETTPPTAVCKDFTLRLDATGNGTLTPEDIDEGSSDNCTIASRELSRTAFTCKDIGTHPVTLTVTDSAGNVSTCDAMVTVEPTGRFTGTAGGSWFDADNWCAGVPTSASDVTIRTQVLIDSFGAVARNVLIENGGELIVGSGNGASLTVIDTLAIESGGALTITANGTVDANALVVHAGGTLNLVDPSALLLVGDLVLEPGAMLNWQAGTMELRGTLSSVDALLVGCQGPGAALLLDGGVVNSSMLGICTDGTLKGNGSVLCAAINEGWVSPGFSAGRIDMVGGFTQPIGGSLRIELGGLEVVSGHDLLLVSGDASLSGALSVELINGFVPAWGDAFEVVVADGVGGRFAVTQLPTLAAPLYMQAAIEPTRVLLRVRRIADFNDDGIVDGSDLGTLLGFWGPCAGCEADFNGDGLVDGNDLGTLLGYWGA